jgi:hypothetical protein
MRVQRSADVPIEAVPVLVDRDWKPSTDDEAQIVARVDGLTTVEEIACEVGARLSCVRALIYQLAWLGAVELHEWMDVEDDQIVEEIPNPPPLVAEPMPLTRRRKPAPEVRMLPNESPLVSAVLAELARLTQ